MFKLLSATLGYINSHYDTYVLAVKTHILIFVLVLAAAVIIGIPLGILSSKKPVFSTVIINIFSALKMIPSLALLLVFIPIIGTGMIPASIALVLHALPTMLINTYTGFKQIDAAVTESAVAMGMTRGEILRKVEFPLALPLVFTGLRTCSVDIIATTTIAAYIGAGGLGQFVVVGLSNLNSATMLAGSLTVALISLIVDLVFFLLQKGLIRYEKA
ncbi:MAG: ABC transporter permease [Treponema sp.]|jgi:osmoprotectant transport system permease protein|nr:ABC transporter permease [Treponema sp.]